MKRRQEPEAKNIRGNFPTGGNLYNESEFGMFTQDAKSYLWSQEQWLYGFLMELIIMYAFGIY